MARCGCSGSACSCSVTGSRVPVSGNGTSLSPYVIGVGTEQIAAPSTGGTVVVAATSRSLLLSPAGTLATLTITLPLLPTPAPGSFDQEIIIVSTAALTALTVAPGAGTTVAGMPTTLAANGFFRARLFGTVWRRVG